MVVIFWGRESYLKGLFPSEQMSVLFQGTIFVKCLNCQRYLQYLVFVTVSESSRLTLRDLLCSCPLDVIDPAAELLVLALLRYCLTG